jgi:hypothetical protein
MLIRSGFWSTFFECEEPALHAAQLRQQLGAGDQDVFPIIKQQNARAWPLCGACRTFHSSDFSIMKFCKSERALAMEVVSVLWLVEVP